MVKRLILFVLPIIFIATIADAEQPKFYSDDPLSKERDTQDASGAKPVEIDLVYDLAENLFSKPGDKTVNVRAQNINTIDEVPDSSWYTNRLDLTAEKVAKGPNTTEGPASSQWTVVASKNDGVTPGFTIEDSAGVRWFIKPDPPGYLGMATGAEVAATKLFWALGYYVPETHIAALNPTNLVIAEGTMIKTPAGNKRKMKEGDIKKMLRRAAKNPDGSYRVMASKALEGQPLGGFRFYGTRPDDPNDIIPHEHRRELRGYKVFAAWLNHVDCKALQSLDTLIAENGKSFVRHHLLDFSSTLGSGSIYPHQYWEGYEQIMEKGGHIGKDVIAFGFLVEPYRTDPFFESSSVGRIPENYNGWDPDSWEPRASNAAFRKVRDDDKFWAARKLMAITDDMILAAVQSGQLSDAKSEEFLVAILKERRRAILQKYLTVINPVVNPNLNEDGVLEFENAAVSAGFANAPERYQVNWYRYDNSNGQSNRIGGVTVTETRAQSPSGFPQQVGAYIKVEISAKSAEHPSWESPVHAFFVRTAEGWKLVGFERMLEG